MQVRHKQGQFFIEVKGKKATLDYALNGKKLDLFHTFTDEELRGQGIAEKLAQAAFEYAKKNRLRIVPTCEYVQHFLKKHPEWESITEH